MNFRSLLSRSASRLAGHPSAVLSIQNADVFRFGDGDAATPVFQNLSWTIRDEESWCVVGAAAKTAIVELLTGGLRVRHDANTIYPFLGTRDIYTAVKLVSFSTRLRAGGGEFYDYTARYGALRDSDRNTLRQSLPTSLNSKLAELAEQLDLTHLLDLPLVALSNGQTRRARILDALLASPEILVLDEPFTGLDAQHRPRLSNLLRNLHNSKNPRVIMTLRPQDPIPDWICNALVLSRNGQVTIGVRESSRIQDALHDLHSKNESESESSNGHGRMGAARKEIVSMKDVNIAYEDRQVLKNINWVVRAGDRWHLQGANGSGKTTLTSLLNGSHPQSYTQSHLHLFSKPRANQPTVLLQQLIGHVSPELFNAFPRRLGPDALTVKDAIASGFDGNFVYRKTSEEQNQRIWELARELAPSPLPGDADNAVLKWLQTSFALLSPGEQNLALLMRALVAKPGLIILDEAFAGMDDATVEKVRRYLNEKIGEDQAVIFVGHWSSEVPWSKRTGLKLFKLQEGTGTAEE